MKSAGGTALSQIPDLQARARSTLKESENGRGSFDGPHEIPGTDPEIEIFLESIGKVAVGYQWS